MPTFIEVIRTNFEVIVKSIESMEARSTESKEASIEPMKAHKRKVLIFEIYATIKNLLENMNNFKLVLIEITGNRPHTSSSTVTYIKFIENLLSCGVKILPPLQIQSLDEFIDIIEKVFKSDDFNNFLAFCNKLISHEKNMKEMLGDPRSNTNVQEMQMIMPRLKEKFGGILDLQDPEVFKKIVDSSSAVSGISPYVAVGRMIKNFSDYSHLSYPFQIIQKFPLLIGALCKSLPDEAAKKLTTVQTQIKDRLKETDQAIGLANIIENSKANARSIFSLNKQNEIIGTIISILIDSQVLGCPPVPNLRSEHDKTIYSSQELASGFDAFLKVILNKLYPDYFVVSEGVFTVSPMNAENETVVLICKALGITKENRDIFFSTDQFSTKDLTLLIASSTSATDYTKFLWIMLKIMIPLPQNPATDLCMDRLGNFRELASTFYIKGLVVGEKRRRRHSLIERIGMLAHRQLDNIELPCEGIKLGGTLNKLIAATFDSNDDQEKSSEEPELLAKGGWYGAWIKAKNHKHSRSCSTSLSMQSSTASLFSSRPSSVNSTNFGTSPSPSASASASAMTSPQNDNLPRLPNLSIDLSRISNNVKSSSHVEGSQLPIFTDSINFRRASTDLNAPTPKKGSPNNSPTEGTPIAPLGNAGLGCMLTKKAVSRSLFDKDDDLILAHIEINGHNLEVMIAKNLRGDFTSSSSSSLILLPCEVNEKLRQICNLAYTKAIDDQGITAGSSSAPTKMELKSIDDAMIIEVHFGDFSVTTYQIDQDGNFLVHKSFASLV